MKYTRWTRATIREPILNFQAGDAVVFVRSTVKHTASGIGATFWVMAVHSKNIIQVSENAFGTNAYKLLSYGEEVTASKQSDVEERAKGLLAASAYAPANRKHMTYFDTDRSKLTERFRYVDSNETGS